MPCRTQDRRCSEFSGCSRCSYALPIEARLAPRAEYLEGPVLADRIGADEDPVLPCRQATEDARGHGLARSPAQARFHSGQCIRRETRALLQRNTDFAVPVECIGRRGDEAQGAGISGTQCTANSGPTGFQRLMLLIEARRKT